MDNEDLNARAKKFLEGTLEQQLPNDPDGMEIALLCPTCYKTRKERVKEDFATQIGEQLIVNQCARCRAIGREIDLDELKKVLSGERLPLPKIDKYYTLSDLITDLLESDKEKEE